MIVHDENWPTLAAYLDHMTGEQLVVPSEEREIPFAGWDWRDAGPRFISGILLRYGKRLVFRGIDCEHACNSHEYECEHVYRFATEEEAASVFRNAEDGMDCKDFTRWYGR